MEIVGVIMAGGKGERFWPRSTPATPKQFLSLWGEGTLLQQAFGRAMKITGNIDRVYVITGPDYVDLVVSQLPTFPHENLIVEPASRDTAPAVGYALVHIRRQFLQDAVMVVIPSDHVVLDEERFVETLHHAAEVALGGDYLVTIGIKPTRPEEGYGYIECGDPIPECNEPFREEHKKRDGRIYRVKKFIEKPCVDLALEFLKGGRHLWNAGIFVWKLSTIRQAFSEYAPVLHEGLSEIEEMLQRIRDVGSQRDFSTEIQKRFLALERKSIDYALLEKARNILVVPGDFGWDDVGTWAALERIYDKDENGNVINGSAIAIEASGNIIDNTIGDKLLVTFGVKDLVVVNSEDFILVTDKKRSSNLKNVTDLLNSHDIMHETEKQSDKNSIFGASLDNITVNY